jgi:hypothetical protein
MKSQRRRETPSWSTEIYFFGETKNANLVRNDWVLSVYRGTYNLDHHCISNFQNALQLTTTAQQNKSEDGASPT